MKQGKCNRIDVPEDCCYLRFGKVKYDVSAPDFETIRGEEMIIDLDKKGRVIGIELLSGKKAKKKCGA